MSRCDASDDFVNRSLKRFSHVLFTKFTKYVALFFKPPTPELSIDDSDLVTRKLSFRSNLDAIDPPPSSLPLKTTKYYILPLCLLLFVVVCKLTDYYFRSFEATLKPEAVPLRSAVSHWWLSRCESQEAAVSG
jgi:hypothetical protein